MTPTPHEEAGHTLRYLARDNPIAVAILAAILGIGVVDMYVEKRRTQTLERTFAGMFQACIDLARASKRGPQ